MNSRASLPLFPGLSPPRRVANLPLQLPEPGQRSHLWLCLDFYLLPLEIFAESSGIDAVAVIEGEGSGRRVLLCNASAESHGVYAGLPVNAALALCPSLVLLGRDSCREREAFQRLAAWAGQFTAMVSLEAPRSLLLEIRASLKLFGGLDSFLANLAVRLEHTGFTSRQAVAPMPRAALWLARTENGVVVATSNRLVDCLGHLPLACTHWPRKVLDRLTGMGIRQLGDVLRLPRDGFARRFGPERLSELDRAIGKLSEPREAFRLPEVYTGKVNMPEETLDRALMVRGMERLLTEMEGFLRACQRGVQQPAFRFWHSGNRFTRIVLGLSRTTTSACSIADLLVERMERLELPAPVTGLSLDSGETLPIETVHHTLYNNSRNTLAAEETARTLVDRLRARLGQDAVRGLCILPEHRPEAAWAYTEPGNPTGTVRDERRPFWILERPRPLAFRDGRPCFEGRLRIESGPERIETGWWDGRDVTRDYFVAGNTAGMKLWVYRERRIPRRWFLHGVFG
ncbi:MAG: Y-family DNA polymerase [Gammaproteobacteria bacterium]